MVHSGPPYVRPTGGTAVTARAEGSKTVERRIFYQRHRRLHHATKVTPLCGRALLDAVVCRVGQSEPSREPVAGVVDLQGRLSRNSRPTSGGPPERTLGV